MRTAKPALFTVNTLPWSTRAARPASGRHTISFFTDRISPQRRTHTARYRNGVSERRAGSGSRLTHGAHVRQKAIQGAFAEDAAEFTGSPSSGALSEHLVTPTAPACTLGTLGRFYIRLGPRISLRPERLKVSLPARPLKSRNSPPICLRPAHCLSFKICVFNS